MSLPLVISANTPVPSFILQDHTSLVPTFNRDRDSHGPQHFFIYIYIFLTVFYCRFPNWPVCHNLSQSHVFTSEMFDNPNFMGKWSVNLWLVGWLDMMRPPSPIGGVDRQQLCWARTLFTLLLPPPSLTCWQLQMRKIWAWSYKQDRWEKGGDNSPWDAEIGKLLEDLSARVAVWSWRRQMERQWEN